ncbi:oligosaccharide flippase family protein [Roseibium marinum]|uniref:PST family polysaccharide transporter n=1 Tax=Roseibium marinum TaxID=281252 RepID=A0A2S3UTN0_9HYPH|nr:oligosaccharide flippase family protein [Roseibium marinum]POF31088.1 PST family polysaccharide transporter [Roseibium marinum]
MIALRALKGAGWLVFSRFTGRAIDFIMLPILARVLTPADFGLAALAMSLVLIIDTILEVPVTQALVRLEKIDREHLDTGFTLGAMRSGLVALVVLVLIWPFSHINDEQRLVPLILFIVTGSIAKGFVSPAMVHFARKLGFLQTFMMEFGGKICAFGAAMILLYAGATYWAIAANYVAAAFAATALSYILAPYRPRLSLKRLNDFAAFIGWYSVAQLVSALNWQFDRLLVGLGSDKASLGRYAIASDLATMPTQSLIGPALQSVMAAFSLIGNDRERLQQAFLKAVRFAMMISVPACVGISLTADLATALLLGPKWADAAVYVSILALAVLPIPYFQTLYSMCLAIDRPFLIVRVNVIDLCLRLLLLTAGFYAFSVLGVSIARAFLAVLMSGFYLYYARQVVGVGIVQQVKNLWKIGVAAIAMAIGVAILRREMADLEWPAFYELAVVAPVGAAVYFAALFALGLRVIIGRSRLEFFDRY